jgi:hypothetical protein
MIQGFLVHFPVPVNEIICGLFPALSVTTSEAVLFPLALGVNATLSVHDLLIKLSALVHEFFVMLNSPAFTPVIVIEDMLNTEIVVVFVNFSVLTRLVPTTFAP